MLEGNTDEIRMEISSCFVKKHEYWERRRGGNPSRRLSSKCKEMQKTKQIPFSDTSL